MCCDVICNVKQGDSWSSQALGEDARRTKEATTSPWLWETGRAHSAASPEPQACHMPALPAGKQAAVPSGHQGPPGDASTSTPRKPHQGTRRTKQRRGGSGGARPLGWRVGGVKRSLPPPQEEDGRAATLTDSREGGVTWSAHSSRPRPGARQASPSPWQPRGPWP